MRKLLAVSALLCTVPLFTSCGDSTECGANTTEVDGVCVGGDTGLDCGAGTFEFNGECVAVDPNDSTAPVTTITPGGGELPANASVRLTTDEPATIYYTIDGSTPDTSSPSGSSPVVISTLDTASGDVEVKFFAEDPAGNAETEKSATFTKDLAPGPVTSFAAVATGSDIDLAWTNPTAADFAGVVVARINGPVGDPVNGVTYTVGDAIDLSTEVVYIGTGTSLNDPGLAPSFTTYAAWAYDTAGNYSRIAMTGAEVALPAQTSTLTIDVDAGTVTVGTQPSFTTVEANFENFDGGTGTLDIQVRLQNDAMRPLFNTKFVVTTLTNATSMTNNDGTMGANEYRRFRHALPTGIGDDQGLTFSGVAAGTVVTVDFSVENHRLLIGSGDYAGATADVGLGDTGTGGAIRANLPELQGYMDGDNANDYAPHMLGGVLSLDGRTLYGTLRQSSAVVAIDLATMSPTMSTPRLSPLKSHTRAPRFDYASNTLYVGLTVGNHSYPTDGLIATMAYYVVALNPSTMRERWRVEIVSPFSAETQGRLKGLTLSADGTMAAVTLSNHADDATGGELHLVDLTTRTQLDLDSATAGVQGAVVGCPSPEGVTFSPDGSTVYTGVNYDTDSDIMYVVDADPASGTFGTVTEVGSVGYGGGASFLWIGNLLHIGSTDQDSGIFTYDPSTGNLGSLANYTDNVGAMILDPADGSILTIDDYDGTNLLRVDATDGTVLETYNTGSNDGHWLALTPY